MGRIRILIVDDSVVFRSQIRSALTAIPQVEVVAVAATGKIALQKIVSGGVDLIILDLEMPEMNGIELLTEMRKRAIFTKVILFSSFSQRGAEITLEALSLGASDFVTKPNSHCNNTPQNPTEMLRGLFASKIQELFPQEFENLPQLSNSQTPSLPGLSPSLGSSLDWTSFKPQVIVIGSSTGGPSALEEIFAKVREPISCPILIAQHMPPIFTATFAERLAKISGIRCSEGEHQEVIEPNRIYVAPGNYHMSLAASSLDIQIILDQEAPEHSVRPAVDPLFRSAARLFGQQTLGVILTGMGEDGKRGAREIKSAGGRIIIQDEQSCVVFGMPRAVFSAGTYDKIGNLDTIAKLIRSASE